MSINTYFTAGHEWLRLEGDIAIVGITAHAAEQLGEVVHVELKAEGTKLRRGDVVGFVESVKAASDVYAPLSGEIVAHNPAVRVRRQDVWWRKSISHFLNRMRERTTRIRISDQGCMLRGYHRSIIDAINRCHEVSTFVPALGYAFARNPVEIPVAHAERAAGESKYSLYRLIRLNFDLMTGFSVVPLQCFSMAGGVIAVLSLLFVAYLAVRRLTMGPEVQGVFTLFGIAFFLIGVLLLGLGVVGEYIGRIYEQVRQRPRYTVATVLEEDDASERVATVNIERRRESSE